VTHPETVTRPAPPVRVPAVITPWFWVVKVLTTAMGEATSDWMVRVFGPVPAVLAGFTVFALALGLQLRQRRYRAWTYWAAVAMVAVFGTQAADVLHIKFGLPYSGSVVIYGLALAVIFMVWQRTEKTLSIHSITNARRELFYWATVLATFALGTATGDMTATTLHLGYLASGVLFAVVILVPAVAFRARMLGPVSSFWFAYVITRPLGASFADYMCKPRSVSGVDLGDGWVALGLALALVLGVAFLAHTRLDVPVRPASAA
jgi:uncharacterized membrane-anchored protein